MYLFHFFFCDSSISIRIDPEISNSIEDFSFRNLGKKDFIEYFWEDGLHVKESL